MEVLVQTVTKKLLPDSKRAVLRPPGTRSQSGSFFYFYALLQSVASSLRMGICNSRSMNGRL